MKDLAKFLLELGMLKRVKRSGWWTAGIKDPETVAEHSWRAGVVGYILAREGKVDADKVMRMLLFHDVAECRLDDINKVQRRYLDTSEAEKKVVEDQSKLLPNEIGNEYKELMKEFNEGKTREAVIAKDADNLECAIQAKEYMDFGSKLPQNWIENVRKALKTEVAKKLLEIIEKSDPWWTGLKKLD